MGKELQQRNYYRIHLENQHQQGRFWGMFHVLDYHHWDYVKKILHKKHIGKNRLRCCVAPRTVSFNFVNGDEHVDDESEHLLLEHRVRQNCSVDRAAETSPDLVISNPIIVLPGDRFRRRFDKARSFPSPNPNSLETKLYRSSTMNHHRQNEVWLFPKGEKLNLVPFDSRNDSKPVQFDESMKHSSSKHGWKINPFRVFKKKIKRALQETRKEEAVDSSKTKQPRMTRLSSLNDSIDKYTRLFEGSYGKVTDEDGKVNGHKSLRRRQSLPNQDALNLLLTEVSKENLRSVSFITDGEEPLTDDSLEESEADIDLTAESEPVKAVNEGGCAPVSVVDDADSTTIVAPNLVLPSRCMSVKETDPDFKLVTEILHSVGFSESDAIPTWDSIQLPLSPTLYHELDPSDEVVFDLINEALMEVYERYSYPHFVRPKGKHVVDEIWMIVKFYKDMKPELDVSLDNIVSRDMSRHHGWVNPRLDQECVALEIEDLIFNQLVEEFRGLKYE